MNYNLTSLDATSTTTILDVFSSLNTNSGNVFGTLLLIAVFLGYYLLFKKEDKIVDLLTSSFLTSIVATLFLIIGWITWIIYLPVLILFFIVFILYFILN